MKKLLAFLALVAVAHGAGTVQTSITPLIRDDNGRSITTVIAWYWTGDSVNGTIPATPIALSCCTGYFVLSAEFVPGTPSPTAGYAASLNDVAGVDVLAGAASSLSATIPQGFAAGSNASPIQGSLTLTLSGQNVAGAKGTVFVFLLRPGSANFAALLHPGSGGGGGAVSSVFGRIGAVVASNGDYSASQVTNSAATNTANTFTGGFLQNMSADDLLLPVHSADPGTCSAGQIEFNSTAQTFRGCTPANTWTGFGGGITQLTGDGTAGPGSGSQALTLATVNGSPGSCGDASHTCQVVTNGKGLVTSQTAFSVSGTLVLTSISPTFGGTTNITLGTQTMFNLGTMTGNTTIAVTAPTQAVGDYFLACQDATGSRTITWPASFKNIPQLDPTPNICSLVGPIDYDGTTNYYKPGSTQAGLVALGTTAAACTVVPTSNLCIWLDSASGTVVAKDNAGNRYIMPKCAGTASTCASTDLSDTSNIDYLNQVQTISAVKTFTATPKTSAINDGNGNPFIASTATTSAVDSVTITNAATANPATVTVGATGSDANVNLALAPKGTGHVQVTNVTGSTQCLQADTNGNVSGTGAGCGGGGGSSTVFDFSKYTEYIHVWRASTGALGLSYGTQTTSSLTTSPWFLLSGTPTFNNRAADSNFQYYMEMAPTAGGSMAGALNGFSTASEWFRQANLRMLVYAEPVTSTNARYKFGFSDCNVATQIGSDSPACNQVQLLASTTTGAAHWYCLVGNGTTNTTQDTGVAWTAGTAYKLQLDLNSSSVTCTVNGTATAVSTNMPATGNGMWGGEIMVGATSGAATTTLRWGWFYIQSDN